MHFKGYRHGINFGGWFSQCYHSEKRYDNFIKMEDFARVARWGLDHVRIPVDYELVLNSDLSYREDGFRRLQDCIEWCRRYDLNMILDLHKTVGFSFDDGENESGFFEDEHYQQIFYDLWDEFARRFGHCDNLAFELLNEVSDKEYCAAWNRIASRAIKTIRTHAADIPILVGGYYNNSIEAIKDLDLPVDDDVIYNFHCYSPLIFTHQGAYWIKGMDRNFRMRYRTDQQTYANNTAKQISKDYLDSFGDPDKIIDASYFEELFAEAVEIAKRKNIKLYCGEYGVIDLADPGSTLEWLSDITSVFDKYDIGRALWSYKEMDFGLVDAHYDIIRNKMLEMI